MMMKKGGEKRERELEGAVKDVWEFQVKSAEQV